MARHCKHCGVQYLTDRFCTHAEDCPERAAERRRSVEMMREIEAEGARLASITWTCKRCKATLVKKSFCPCWVDECFRNDAERQRKISETS